MTALRPALLLSLLACAVPRPTPAPRPLARLALPVVELQLRNARVFAEVATTPEERSLGLMFREFLAPDSGMLFVFENQRPVRFWMKNTLIPLSIAYLDSTGVIVNICEMQPGDTITRYPSAGPARYALEVNSGWFLQHGIRPGDTIKGLP
ncbi:MAG: DUF192 domain-containing protein [candidate division WOR-3 bacterium]